MAILLNLVKERALETKRAVQWDSEIDMVLVVVKLQTISFISHRVCVWHLCSLDESNRFVSLPG